MNKRGFDLAIGTLVKLVLGIVFLIAVITVFVMNWEDFSKTLEGYGGSDEQITIDLCKTQCDLNKAFDFCCSNKTVGDLSLRCEDLNIECEKFECEEDC